MRGNGLVAGIIEATKILIFVNMSHLQFAPAN